MKVWILFRDHGSDHLREMISVHLSEEGARKQRGIEQECFKRLSGTLSDKELPIEPYYPLP